MSDLKWPFVVVFVAVIGGIVTMFGLTDDSAVQNRLIGYMDAIVPFVVGAASGGSVGALAGFARAKGFL
jgi:hypothetical protein